MDAEGDYNQALKKTILRFGASACKKALSDELYATEKVYELVKQGVPFRDAYKMVAKNL